MDKYKFGEFIYKRRKVLGMTQDDLGRKLGVTNKAISKWETGETMPDLIMIESLARVLGVGIDELVTQKEYISKREGKLKRAVITLSILLTCCLIVFCAVTVPLIVRLKNKKEPIVLNALNCLDYLTVDTMESVTFTMTGGVILSIAVRHARYYSLMNGSISLTIDISTHTQGFDSKGQEITYSYLDRKVDLEIRDNLTESQLILEPGNVDIATYMSVETEFLISSCTGTIVEVSP